MKVNLVTMDLFTDDDTFIKHLHCPYKMEWDAMDEVGTAVRNCSRCNHKVVDTANYTDKELVTMVTENPDTCFKIDYNQPNVTIKYHGITRL